MTLGYLLKISATQVGVVDIGALLFKGIEENKTAGGTFPSLLNPPR